MSPDPSSEPIQGPLASSEPAQVVLFRDYVNHLGTLFPWGTLLRRLETGQYAPEGTQWGGSCIGRFADIQAITTLTVGQTLDLEGLSEGLREELSTYQPGWYVFLQEEKILVCPPQDFGLGTEPWAPTQPFL